MNGIVGFIRQATVLLVLLFIASGCTTKLAPEYDKALVDGITNSSPKLLELFASVSTGASSDYTKREKTYNELIGAFQSLQIQSQSRPVPDNAAVRKITDALAAKYPNLKVNGETPSATALGEIANQLLHMKENDKSNKLPATKVDLYKNASVTALDQAITYESFLER